MCPLLYLQLLREAHKSLWLRDLKAVSEVCISLFYVSFTLSQCWYNDQQFGVRWFGLWISTPLGFCLLTLHGLPVLVFQELHAHFESSVSSLPPFVLFSDRSRSMYKLYFFYFLAIFPFPSCSFVSTVDIAVDDLAN